MDPEFTVVLPIHDEEPMLLRTLPSVFALEPSEILVGLDRCSDRSEALIKRVADLLGYRGSLVFHSFGEEEGRDYKFRGAFLRRELYRRAKTDVVLNSSADLYLDPSIRGLLSQVSPRRFGLTSYHYYEIPWTLQSFERAVIGKVYAFSLAGLLSFSRECWLKTEDLEDLKRIPRAEDTHLQLAIRRRYRVKHFHTRSIHLRPNETRRDHFNRGVAVYSQIHRSPVKAFIHSVVMVRPAYFSGFMSERRRRVVSR